MVRFLLRRVAVVLVTLWVASLVVFFLLNVLPGSPAQVILGTQATPGAVHLLTVKLGLDKPLWDRYLDWFGGLITGHLGHSYISSRVVGGEIASALQVSGPLVGFALVFGLLVAIPLGILGATRRGRASGAVISSISQVGVATPSFVVGLILIIVVAVEFHLLPAGGFTPWSNPAESLKSLVLPVVSLGLVSGAVLSRYLRAGVAEVISSDYFRMARAKGLSRRHALWRHGLRNAALPVVTVLGLELGGLIVGAVVVENVFTLPGVGTLLFQAIENRDLAVVQDVVMMVVGIVLLANLIVDISYRLIDPRIGVNS